MLPLTDFTLQVGDLKTFVHVYQQFASKQEYLQINKG